MRLSNIIFLLLLLNTFFISYSQHDSVLQRVNAEVRAAIQPALSERLENGIYNREGFERYKVKIEVLDDCDIRYDSIILRVYNGRPEYRIIFEKGIFYPGIFIGNQLGEIEKPEIRPDSITALGSCFTNYNVIGVDVLEEIKLEKNSFTTKRFRMWQRSCGIANPREYIFELTNDSATETTDLKSFIDNSKLTYFKFITIII